jgi:mRNA interferase RelE/StbE
MVCFSDEIEKGISKKTFPKEVFLQFDNAFKSLDLTKDLSLFDIKKLKDSKNKKRAYYRIRKGKFRAIFFIQDNDYFIITLDKKEDVYRKWE